jgi:hypothetical protein
LEDEEEERDEEEEGDQEEDVAFTIGGRHKSQVDPVEYVTIRRARPSVPADTTTTTTTTR